MKKKLYTIDINLLMDDPFQLTPFSFFMDLYSIFFKNGIHNAIVS